MNIVLDCPLDIMYTYVFAKASLALISLIFRDVAGKNIPQSVYYLKKNNCFLQKITIIFIS